MAEPSVTLFGPIDTLVGPYIEFVLLGLVVANLLTRKLANDRYRRQAREGGAEAISRHPLHVASTWGMVLASFYYLTLHHHSGVVLTVLVVGTVLTDFFEFEARQLEAREDRPIERPKGAVVASLIALTYAAYVSLFTFVAPLWNSVV